MKWYDWAAIAASILTLVQIVTLAEPDHSGRVHSIDPFLAKRKTNAAIICAACFLFMIYYSIAKDSWWYWQSWTTLIVIVAGYFLSGRYYPFGNPPLRD